MSRKRRADTSDPELRPSSSRKDAAGCLPTIRIPTTLGPSLLLRPSTNGRFESIKKQQNLMRVSCPSGSAPRRCSTRTSTLPVESTSTPIALLAIRLSSTYFRRPLRSCSTRRRRLRPSAITSTPGRIPLDIHPPSNFTRTARTALNPKGPRFGRRRPPKGMKILPDGIARRSGYAGTSSTGWDSLCPAGMERLIHPAE